MQDTKIDHKENVEVVISLEKGIVQCTPSTVYVHWEQAIEWKCKENFPFAVHLGYDSPFEKVHHQAPRGQRIHLGIASNTRRGRYKYVVAVFDEQNVWIEDPEIIVRR